MSKLGFVCQRYDSCMDPLLRAGPSVLICIENPGLIDSLKPLAPNSLYIYRDWSPEQPLDDPKKAAEAKIEALKPVIYKSGAQYHGFQFYNEIAQFDLKVALAFQQFQLYCLDELGKMGVPGAVDNDSTWHPHLPIENEPLWKIKSKVYEHPAAKWRCRHEYERQPYYSGGVDGWTRHKKEIHWLRLTGRPVLPHIIDEWGWDNGPPLGTWRIGVKTKEFIQGLKDYEALMDPAVIAYAYFGLGLDQAWPAYGLLKPEAPPDIIPAIESFMREKPAADPSWSRVDENVRRWYFLLKDESFRLWPYQTIPYQGVELHGDRIGAVIIFCESGGDSTAQSRQPALRFNNQDYYAWGLMQVISRVPGHPWFSNRPTIQELLEPATNIKWGMGIFHGSLQTAKGDLWEALRRYSGFAAPNYTMADFWAKYGKKFQETYERWFGIKIAGPDAEASELETLHKKYNDLCESAIAARNTLNAALGEQ